MNVTTTKCGMLAWSRRFGGSRSQQTHWVGVRGTESIISLLLGDYASSWSVPLIIITTLSWTAFRLRLMIMIWMIMINELASSLCANSQSVPFIIIVSYRYCASRNYWSLIMIMSPCSWRKLHRKVAISLFGFISLDHDDPWSWSWSWSACQRPTP